MKAIEAVDEKEKAYLDLSKSGRVVKARKREWFSSRSLSRALSRPENASTEKFIKA